MPPGGVAVDREGRLTLPYHRYLAGVEETSKRVSANVTLSAGTTIAELKADIAALKAALVAAGLMES